MNNEEKSQETIDKIISFSILFIRSIDRKIGLYFNNIMINNYNIKIKINIDDFNDYIEIYMPKIDKYISMNFYAFYYFVKIILYQITQYSYGITCTYNKKKYKNINDINLNELPENLQLRYNDEIKDKKKKFIDEQKKITDLKDNILKITSQYPFKEDDTEKYFLEKGMNELFNILYSFSDKFIENNDFREKLSRYKKIIEEYKKSDKKNKGLKNNFETELKNILLRFFRSIIDSKEISKKIDSKEISKKIDSKEITKKIDSKEISKKIDSKKISKKIDSKEFNNLWLSKDYGPIATTLIYLANYKYDVDYRAIQKAWINLKYEIIKINQEEEKNTKSKKIPKFVLIFKRLQKEGKNLSYYRCGRYNFIYDFYIGGGGCNCACGTFLAFIISKMYPEVNYDVVAIAIPNHFYILVKDKNRKKIYKLETTNISGTYTTIDDINFIDGLYIIKSEQTLAINILVSYELPQKPYINILKNMLGFDIESNDIECKTKIEKIRNLKNKEIFSNVNDIYSFFMKFFIKQGGIFFEKSNYTKEYKKIIIKTVFRRNQINFNNLLMLFVTGKLEQNQEDKDKIINNEIDVYKSLFCDNATNLILKFESIKLNQNVEDYYMQTCDKMIKN